MPSSINDKGLLSIETERLLLRPYREKDFEVYNRLWSDPVVTRYIGGVPFPREQNWTRFLRHFGMWQVMGFGGFAVRDRHSGDFLGEAGFHDLRRDIEPSLEGTLETGWAFLPAAHGRGIASEAVGAALDWARRQFGRARITCFIDITNAPSLVLAERLGFRPFETSTYQNKPIVMFELGEHRQ